MSTEYCHCGEELRYAINRLWLVTYCINCKTQCLDLCKQVATMKSQEERESHESQDS